MLTEPHPVKMKFDTTLPETWALSKCKHVPKSCEIVCPYIYLKVTKRYNYKLVVATLRIRLTEAVASRGTVCSRLKTWLKIINKHKSWQFTHLLIKQDCVAFSLDGIIAI